MNTKGSRRDQPFKILLLGDSSVGKTSLMVRFTDDKFTDTLTPTIGIDFKLKTISIEHKPVHLQLWDTAGQERFFNIVQSFYRNADAILLVYDRTDAKSFQNVARWMKNIDENAPHDVVRVLVANKCDLHEHIVIPTEHGKRLADEFCVDYFETSAKLGSIETISRIFYCIVEQLLERKQSTSSPSNVKLDKLNDSPDSLYQKLADCC